MKNFFEKLRVEDWVVVWVSIPLLLLAALIPADLPNVPSTLVGEVAWYNIAYLFAIVLVVLGLVTAVHGSNSTTFIGIIWGLLGLVKAAGEFDEIIADIKRKEPFVFSLALCVFELVLAVLLILNPFANIEHHLLLLGLELIVYPFKLHRERGKFVLEAEA